MNSVRCITIEVHCKIDAIFFALRRNLCRSRMFRSAHNLSATQWQQIEFRRRIWLCVPNGAHAFAHVSKYIIAMNKLCRTTRAKRTFVYDCYCCTCFCHCCWGLSYQTLSVLSALFPYSFFHCNLAYANLHSTIRYAGQN